MCCIFTDEETCNSLDYLKVYDSQYSRCGEKQASCTSVVQYQRGPVPAWLAPQLFSKPLKQRFYSAPHSLWLPNKNLVPTPSPVPYSQVLTHKEEIMEKQLSAAKYSTQSLGKATTLLCYKIHP